MLLIAVKLINRLVIRDTDSVYVHLRSESHILRMSPTNYKTSVHWVTKCTLGQNMEGNLSLRWSVLSSVIVFSWGGGGDRGPMREAMNNKI